MCIRDRDKIKPIIFKHLPENIIHTIQIIYKAAIHLKFTPTIWKTSNVVFIPKPGKDSYSKAKSFRPISLSCYLLKGLEKLCTWHMDGKLETHQIHKNQHGFQRGKSTDSAISKTVNSIEKGLDNKEYCIGIFLDIQGAFDTICPQYICTKLL